MSEDGEPKETVVRAGQVAPGPKTDCPHGKVEWLYRSNGSYWFCPRCERVVV